MFDLNNKFNLVFLILSSAIIVCLLAAMITILSRKKFVRLKRDVFFYSVNTIFFIAAIVMAVALAAYNFSVFGFKISVDGINMLLTRNGVIKLSVPHLGRLAALLGFRMGETIVEVVLLVSLINLIAFPIKSFSKRKAVFRSANVQADDANAQSLRDERQESLDTNTNIEERQNLDLNGNRDERQKDLNSNKYDVNENQNNININVQSDFKNQNLNFAARQAAGLDGGEEIEKDLLDAAGLTESFEDNKDQNIYDEDIVEDVSQFDGDAYTDSTESDLEEVLDVPVVEDVEYVAQKTHDEDFTSQNDSVDQKSVVIDVSKLISQEQERLRKSNSDYDSDEELEALIDKAMDEDDLTDRGAIKSDYYFKVASEAEDNEVIKRIKSVYARSKVYNPTNSQEENKQEESADEQSAVYSRKFPDVPLRTIAKTLNWNQSGESDKAEELEVKEVSAVHTSLPITRKHVILNRNNVVNVFADYLKTKNTEEKELLNNSISTILLK